MMQARDIAASRRDFNSDAVAVALYDLATATPEQLLGIVGKVEAETIERPDYYGKTGRLIVTPRDGA